MACTSAYTDMIADEVIDKPERIDINLAPFSGNSEKVDDPATLGIDPDNKVTDFRIVIFNSTTKLLELNLFFNFMTEFENPISFEIKEGTYDFIFLANETSDLTLSATLNAMVEGTTTLTLFESYSFASTAFNESKEIPMSTAYYGVIIDATLGLSDDNGSTYQPATQTQPWSIELERLAIRVDMTLQTTSAFVASDFQSILFSNIPNKVFILPETKDGTILYNSGSYESRTFAKSSGDTGYTTGFQQNAGVYEWKKSRIILPSSVFVNNTVAANGIGMMANYSTLSAQSAVLGPIIGNSYTLPRNYNIVMSGKLYSTLDIALTLEILNWKESEIGVIW